MTIRTIISLFFISISTIAITQDLHSSQPMRSPLLLNPAFTGLGSERFRLGLNYRHQLHSVAKLKNYKTGNLYAYGRWCVNENHFAGGGIDITYDLAGSAAFETTKINLTGAYHVQVNYHGRYEKTIDSYLVLGGHLGWMQQRIKTNLLTFNDQFDNSSGDFDPNLPSNETNLIPTKNNLDSGVGLLYWHSHKIRDKVYNFFNIGAALHHVVRPKVGFINTETELNTRYVIHGSGVFNTKNNFLHNFRPKIIFQYQKPFYQILTGLDIAFHNGNSRDEGYNFVVGGALRIVNGAEKTNNTDALIPRVGIERNGIFVTCSYDINTSKLSPASSYRGGFQLALSYQFLDGCNQKVSCYDFF